MDQEGVAIRTGHHCAMPVMERFGLPATARASLAFYNIREDLDALVAALHKAREVFRLMDLQGPLSRRDRGSQPQPAELPQDRRCHPGAGGLQPPVRRQAHGLPQAGRRADPRTLSFEGSGCAISVASASLMTERLKGKTRAEALKLFDEMHALLTRSDAPAEAEPLGKLAALSGVREYPSRVKCASLCWHTLKGALHGRRPCELRNKPCTTANPSNS